jgi:hypothetical protein
MKFRTVNFDERVPHAPDMVEVAITGIAWQEMTDNDFLLSFDLFANL